MVQLNRIPCHQQQQPPTVIWIVRKDSPLLVLLSVSGLMCSNRLPGFVPRKHSKSSHGDSNSVFCSNFLKRVRISLYPQMVCVCGGTLALIHHQDQTKTLFVDGISLFGAKVNKLRAHTYTRFAFTFLDFCVNRESCCVCARMWWMFSKQIRLSSAVCVCAVWTLCTAVQLWQWTWSKLSKNCLFQPFLWGASLWIPSKADPRLDRLFSAVRDSTMKIFWILMRMLISTFHFVDDEDSFVTFSPPPPNITVRCVIPQIEPRVVAASSRF